MSTLNGPAPRRLSSGKEVTTVSSSNNWLHQYGEFVTSHAGTVGQIESALRSLTMLIPGRFRESELASESLHSAIQLLSLYHDSLLSPHDSKAAAARLNQSPHSRYTRFWASTSTLYKRLALVLQLIQYTELFWEMTAKRRGEKIRWRVVVILEAIKAICRLILLRLTSNRPLCATMLPEREPETMQPQRIEEVEDLEEDELERLERAEATGELVAIKPKQKSKATIQEWKMPRTGLTLPKLPTQPDITNYLLSKVLTADDIKPASSLLHRLSTPLSQVAEVAYILRPLVYALALQRWRGNKKDWRPWLLGLGIEFCARQLAKKEILERTPGGWRGLSSLEKDEYTKRGKAIWWWAMRGAFWENFTKLWIQFIALKLKNKRLLDILGGVIEDYEFLWDEYYFPTATL